MITSDLSGKTDSFQLDYIQNEVLYPMQTRIKDWFFEDIYNKLLFRYVQFVGHRIQDVLKKAG
jgi:hypothetical protein